ncbi:hypothetical protein Dsin_016667 [Dipteronia sinensis]|uniref:Uncharacterized protein n=1 Tax=Dipteronia sinensis TaxID=43782 RepID=A0AAE0ADJ5_9ROSI|nr:hypothetical protein Dsin_016667 [Dipteronia sinensis]
MVDHRQTTKSRHKTIDSFFNKLGDQSTSNTPIDKTCCDELHSFKLQRVETGRVDVSSFDMACDPGLRKPILMYDVNQQDEVRRAYIDMGPCQPKLDEYEKIWDGNQFRRFQYP